MYLSVQVGYIGDILDVLLVAVGVHFGGDSHLGGIFRVLGGNFYCFLGEVSHFVAIIGAFMGI